METNTIETVIENIKGLDINLLETYEVENLIIEAYGDYEYNNNNSVIVNHEEKGEDEIIYQSYVNESDSPVIIIETANGFIHNVRIA